MMACTVATGDVIYMTLYNTCIYVGLNEAKHACMSTIAN